MKTKSTSASGKLFYGEKVRVRVQTKAGWSKWSKTVKKGLSSGQKKSLRSDLADLKVKKQHHEADIQSLEVDLERYEYWLFVAREYGDAQRANELVALIAQVKADIADERNLLKKTNARISKITKMLK